MPNSSTFQQSIHELVMASFIGEIDALKPGNVSRYAAGHDMYYDDFRRSAEVVTPILCDSSLSLGSRVYASVAATQDAVGCNTNLGMLLLFAPLICAYERVEPAVQIRDALKQVLVAVQQSDADQVFAAIRLANPGGLGHAEQNDVNSSINVGLLEAMASAKDRDWIARQYTNDFQEVFTVGLIALRRFVERWNSVEWATVGCYLTWMSEYNDSHIARKYGAEKAEAIKNRTRPIFEEFNNNDNPAGMKNLLLEFDKELKDASINPGTSADLTAASLLLFHLGA